MITIQIGGDLLLPAHMGWEGGLAALQLKCVIGDGLDGGDGAPVTVGLRPILRASRHKCLIGAVEVSKGRRGAAPRKGRDR